jgi:hypothetical protein
MKCCELYLFRFVVLTLLTSDIHFKFKRLGFRNLLLIIVYYVMRTKNGVLCPAASSLAAERSEADKPAKAHKTMSARNNICILFFLQTFITNYLRNVKKPDRRLGKLIN